MKPLISVIVTIYNVEEYLPKCLDSIVNQTYRNLEIILVDDGSPDGCGAICDRYALQDERIRVIHQENCGVAAARNVGLDAVQGEYQMFVDSDDWISLDAVQILYDRMVHDGSDMVIGQMVKVYDDGHTEPSYCDWMQDMVITGQEAVAMLGSERTLPCYPWGHLIKKEAFQNLRFPAQSRAEDVWVFPHVLDACRTISLESRILYFYYQRSNSAVHESKDSHWMESAASAFHVSRFLANRGLWDNAASYCADGLVQLQQVRDTKKAKQLAAGAFSRKEWLQFAKHRPKCICYGLVLHIPRAYKAMRKLWRRVRYKER